MRSPSGENPMMVANYRTVAPRTGKKAAWAEESECDDVPAIHGDLQAVFERTGEEGCACSYVKNVTTPSTRVVAGWWVMERVVPGLQSEVHNHRHGKGSPPGWSCTSAHYIGKGNPCCHAPLPLIPNHQPAPCQRQQKPDEGLLLMVILHEDAVSNPCTRRKEVPNE